MPQLAFNLLTILPSQCKAVAPVVRKPQVSLGPGERGSGGVRGGASLAPAVQEVPGGLPAHGGCPHLHASLCRVGWGIGRMTAGTVVITGGILAAVILLSIIAVLCYCRLQVSSGPWPGATSKPLPIMGADPGAHFRETRPRAVGCGKYKSRGLGVGGRSEGSTQRAHCAMSPRGWGAETSGVVGRAPSGGTLTAAPSGPQPCPQYDCMSLPLPPCLPSHGLELIH